MKCDAPITIRYKRPISDGKGGLIYTFPTGCGKCLPCLMKRKGQWSYRMMEEKRNSFSSYFVTLTYTDENLPIGDFQSTVNKLDHFNFIKNLKFHESSAQLKKREYISSEEMERMRSKEGEFSKGFRKKDYPLKWFAISEYGDRSGRIHWHYILFNLRDTNNINLAWNLGRLQIDECNVNTIDYVLKYMLKDHSGKDYENKGKELSFMSKGIGKCVVDEEFLKYIRTPEGNRVLNERGSKVPLPRYYRKKFISEAEAKIKNAYINEMVIKQEIKEDTDYIKYGLNPDQERVKQKDTRRHLLKTTKKRNHE